MFIVWCRYTHTALRGEYQAWQQTIDSVQHNINIDWMIISMEWYDVSELRPPTGVLFIHRVIYEHGEPWWNYIYRGKLPIRPPELSGNPTSTHLVASKKNGRRNLGIRSIFVHTSEVILTCRRIYDMSIYFSPKEVVLLIFIALEIYVFPWTLGPMASMLTIPPPNWLILVHYNY
jgi:hypothetical protein